MLNKLNTRNYVPKRAKSGAKWRVFVDGKGWSAFSPKIAAEGEEKCVQLFDCQQNCLPLQPLLAQAFGISYWKKKTLCHRFAVTKRRKLSKGNDNEYGMMVSPRICVELLSYLRYRGLSYRPLQRRMKMAWLHAFLIRRGIRIKHWSVVLSSCCNEA